MVKGLILWSLPPSPTHPHVCLFFAGNVQSQQVRGVSRLEARAVGLQRRSGEPPVRSLVCRTSDPTARFVSCFAVRTEKGRRKQSRQVTEARRTTPPPCRARHVFLWKQPYGSDQPSAFSVLLPRCTGIRTQPSTSSAAWRRRK